MLRTTATVVLFAGLGCGTESGRGDTQPPWGPGLTGEAPSTGAASDTDGSLDSDTENPAWPDVGDGLPPGDEDCASVSETADVGPQPADIVFVIDNSGSMSAEAGFVQQHMNAFSGQIVAADIDVHVVLISAYPDDDDAGVCIDPPLGSGGCPGSDANPPSFVHIDSGVGSHNALSRVIEHYAQYESALRPTASKHLVVVSDDDSDLGAGDFMGQIPMFAPALQGLTVHGIVGDEDPIGACLSGTACCLTSAAEGKVYKELIDQTGGVFGNLCDQQFQPIFDAVAEVVIGGATLACEYPIPDPPQGEVFDPDRVNVSFDDGQGGILDIGRVDDPGQCAAVSHGWYYDDPVMPTQIVVCPQTCDTIQGFEAASISIAFGCATIPAG